MLKSRDSARPRVQVKEGGGSPAADSPEWSLCCRQVDWGFHEPRAVRVRAGWALRPGCRIVWVPAVPGVTLVWLCVSAPWPLEGEVTRADCSLPGTWGLGALSPGGHELFSLAVLSAFILGLHESVQK